MKESNIHDNRDTHCQYRGQLCIKIFEVIHINKNEVLLSVNTHTGQLTAASTLAGLSSLGSASMDITLIKIVSTV